jgi:alpha-D-xyloside xylohydrolase
MRGWTMAPERPEVARLDAGTKGYRVAAVFDSFADEHYYGLGQQQKGWMDLRDHEIHCWHDYGAIGGEDVCMPFMVSTRGYGLVWDNPSKTTVNLGFNGQNAWSSEVGDRVSYFVIAGETSDEIYEGYRLLTGNPDEGAAKDENQVIRCKRDGRARDHHEQCQAEQQHPDPDNGLQRPTDL